MEIQENREIFATRVQAGNQTYFVDVKINRQGEPYLTICEVNKLGERIRLMVFEDHAEEFIAAVEQAMEVIREHKTT